MTIQTNVLREITKTHAVQSVFLAEPSKRRLLGLTSATLAVHAGVRTATAADDAPRTLGLLRNGIGALASLPCSTATHYLIFYNC